VTASRDTGPSKSAAGQGSRHPSKGRAPKRPPRTERLGVVEIFAGIGCVAQGFERAGRFKTLVLTDIDKDARDTYVENFPNGARYLRRDIEWLRPRDILAAADGHPIVGLLGCAPCQGFSAAGQRDPDDERNRLLRHYFRLVKSLEPKFLVMENVPRILEYELFQAMLQEIRKKYQVWVGVLNAALFGVPQTRQRAIVIGYHRDLGVAPTAPQPTHLGRRRVFEYTTRRFVRPTTPLGARLLGLYPEVGKPEEFWASQLQSLARRAERLRNLVVVRDALGDLPAAAEDDHPVPCRGNASEYAQGLRNSEIRNHRRWRHRSDFVRRLRVVEEGSGLLDKKYGRSKDRPYFSQAYTRLHRRGLARTITTNFHNAGSGRFLHYNELRTLTVREAARLQGIEDAFTFIGFSSTQERLVGNAFPVPLAEAIARHIGSEIGSVT